MNSCSSAQQNEDVLFFVLIYLLAVMAAHHAAAPSEQTSSLLLFRHPHQHPSCSPASLKSTTIHLFFLFNHISPFHVCLSLSLSPSQLSLLMESFFRVRRLNYCNGVSDTWDLRTNKDWGCWGGGKQRNIIMSFREKLWSVCVTESSQRLCRETFFSSTFLLSLASDWRFPRV